MVAWKWPSVVHRAMPTSLACALALLLASSVPTRGLLWRASRELDTAVPFGQPACDPAYTSGHGRVHSLETCFSGVWKAGVGGWEHNALQCRTLRKVSWTGWIGVAL